MHRRWTLAILGVTLLSPPLAAQVTFEAFTGTAYNLHTRLSISQTDQPDIGFSAHYETRPLDDTPYLGARISFWKDDKAWVVSAIHHKLYLANPPAEVQWFRITYGFNMLTLGRAWRQGNLTYALGAGTVITHASNSVRGKRYLGTGGPLNKGYTFSGATLLGSLQYRLQLSPTFFLSAETMGSASYIEVKVRGGKAKVPAAALHLHGGFGLVF